MKATQLFTKTSKTISADETAKNAQLLIQAGFIDKQMAGVYSYLPMGKMVLDNIIQIIREEMNAVGGNEINLTALQPKEVWDTTGRWSDTAMDIWFKTKLANGSELGLAPTHEEPLTNLMRRFISSYKDLPVFPYQFQIKFRNELRAKNGLLRGREFWMKDLYSFTKDQAEHEVIYETLGKAYAKVYDRLGIGYITYQTFASGGSFSKYSHEFQTLSETGEDTVYVSETRKIAINKEVMTDEVLNDLGLKHTDLVEKRAVEVGNIFTLGTRFSEPLGLNYTDESGSVKPVYMGSYGIGPSRIMGLLAELFADDKGLVWPENVAPFKVFIAQLGESGDVAEKSQYIYDLLKQNNISVFWDDRLERPGAKFADADLYGIPYRLVISDKTIQSGNYELKKRTQNENELMPKESIVKTLASI